MDVRSARDRLERAANRTWEAYRKYGPVDDGRPEGDEFEAALDALKSALIELKVIRANR